MLKSPSGRRIGLSMKTATDDIRYRIDCCSLAMRARAWVLSAPTSERRNSSRRHARHRDGGTGSATASSSGRATLVAMVQGDEFEFQRGAATSPEREQGAEGGQKRGHARDGMAVARETLHLRGGFDF